MTDFGALAGKGVVGVKMALHVGEGCALAMMNDMMSWGGGAMMWGMGIYGVLLVVLLVLAIAALIKYLRS